MKKYIFIILFTACSLLNTLKAQQQCGLITYKTVLIDTVHNKINIQDSIYSEFSFKPYKTKWEMGFINQKIYTKTIQNEKDFYLIVNEPGYKMAMHGVMPDKNSFYELLNYADTALTITKTNITKKIAGRVCKKIILAFGDNKTPSMTLWYDDTIKCHSIIPGAGIKGRNILGLILEYEIAQKNGKSIVTAEKISFENLEDTQFTPDLKGYTVTELK